MIADEHALLKERGVGTGIAELTAQTIAHVIDLSDKDDNRSYKRVQFKRLRHTPDSQSPRPHSSPLGVLCKRRKSFARSMHFGTGKKILWFFLSHMVRKQNWKRIWNLEC